MKRGFSSWGSAIATCLLLGAAGVQAAQLDEIKARAVLVCGVLDIFEPFGYTDVKTRSVVGYDVDVCQAVAGKLGAKVEIKPVSIEARIAELQQGHMDVLGAGLAHTPLRAEQVAFSDAYYVSENVLAVRAGRGITALGELDGKRISYVKGSISEAYIRQALPGATAVGFEDVSSAFTALLQGKVTGFSTSQEVLHKLLNRLGDKAGQYSILQPAIGREVWGLGIRRDEPGMLVAVNSALRELEAEGTMQAIFDKWLGAQTLYRMQRSFKVQPMR
ncbi:transporter substrate-binding domain-containing protein [Pseudomonas sp. MSSRFD41]|uniref:transporter substrate-binding domain-containing protein n=1 Tax=Pseudomonas sp. MSSRFD41 TaxID=1310370 RepID=UPI00163AEBE9|nr:transporter substrate-binding domain-containing protein [Pseudomonas sp. MSSRFD41]MBC2657795.1 transporter substrate-binding domain-containing protein [Pseudomonas sp. MSSRFD41]